MGEKLASDKPNTYQIEIQGELDKSWSSWFDGFAITWDGTVTTITGEVLDQVVLRYVLNRLWDLNLVLISVTKIDPGAMRTTD